MVAICHIWNTKAYLFVVVQLFFCFVTIWVFLSVDVPFVTQPKWWRTFKPVFNPTVPVIFVLLMSDYPSLSILKILCEMWTLLSSFLHEKVNKIGLIWRHFHRNLKCANLLKCFFFFFPRLRLPNSSSCLLQRMLKSSVYRISFCPEEPSTMTSQREVPLRRLNPNICWNEAYWGLRVE